MLPKRLPVRGGPQIVKSGDLSFARFEGGRKIAVLLRQVRDLTPQSAKLIVVLADLEVSLGEQTQFPYYLRPP